MSAWMLGPVAVVYVFVAFDYWRKGNIGLSVAFAAYAIANLGFMLDLWRK